MKEVMWRVLGVAVAICMAALLLYHKFGDHIARLDWQVEQAKDAERRLQQSRNETRKDSAPTVPARGKAIDFQQPSGSIGGRGLRGESAHNKDSRVHQLKNEPEKNGCANGCIYFGTDGPRVALHLDNHNIRVYDLRTGEAQSPILKHDSDVLRCEFSGDGKRLLTFYPVSFNSTSKKLWAWNLQSGKQALALSSGEGIIVSSRFSPDGNRVLATVLRDPTSDGRRLISYVWNAQTGELLKQVQHKDRALDWSFSPDGELVLATTPKAVRVLDTHTGEPIGPALEPGKGWFWVPDRDFYDRGKPIFSNDNKRVVTLAQNAYGHLRIQLRDVATGKTVLPTWTYEKGPTLLLAANFSSDDRRLATIIDGNEPMRFTVGEVKPTTALPPGEVTIWDTQSGQRLTTCRYEQRGGVSGLLFSPDGQRLAVTCVSIDPPSASVSIFDTTTGYAIAPSFRFEKGLRKTAFTPDGTQLIVVGVDGYAGIWDAKMGREISRVQVPPR